MKEVKELKFSNEQEFIDYYYASYLVDNGSIESYLHRLRKVKSGEIETINRNGYKTFKRMIDHVLMIKVDDQTLKHNLSYALRLIFKVISQFRRF